MTTETYPAIVDVEPTFTAEFTYAIESIRTTTIGDREGVITSATISVRGAEGETSFALPHTVQLDEPGDSFIALGALAEADVVAWCVSKLDNLTAIKSHIQMIVDRDKVLKTSVPATMPWKPEPTTQIQQQEPYPT